MLLRPGGRVRHLRVGPVLEETHARAHTRRPEAHHRSGLRHGDRDARDRPPLPGLSGHGRRAARRVSSVRQSEGSRAREGPTSTSSSAARRTWSWRSPATASRRPTWRSTPSCLPLIANACEDAAPGRRDGPARLRLPGEARLSDSAGRPTSRLLRRSGSGSLPEWSTVFDELPAFLRQTRWVASRRALLAGQRLL